eukprot:SAG11_NODE_3637_length_2320_cov_4.687528_1_plen_121_part_00
MRTARADTARVWAGGDVDAMMGRLGLAAEAMRELDGARRSGRPVDPALLERLRAELGGGGGDGGSGAAAEEEEAEAVGAVGADASSPAALGINLEHMLAEAQIAGPRVKKKGKKKKKKKK